MLTQSSGLAEKEQAMSESSKPAERSPEDRHLAAELVERADPAGKNTGKSRNGTRSKKVLTDVGPVEIEVAP